MMHQTMMPPAVQALHLESAMKALTQLTCGACKHCTCLKIHVVVWHLNFESHKNVIFFVLFGKKMVDDPTFDFINGRKD